MERLFLVNFSTYKELYDFYKTEVEPVLTDRSGVVTLLN